jgi:RNA polymerase sigma factor (sigma-70 family)
MTYQEIEILDMQDNALQMLSDKERETIELRFGLINREFLTYKEVARKRGVSVTRVEQVLKRSFRKIRRYMYLNKHLTDTFPPNNNNQTTQ